MSFGNTMHLYQFQVMCLWPRQPERETLEAWEGEIFAADVALRAAFWGDYTLNAEATRLNVTDSRVSYQTYGVEGSRIFYRALEFEVEVSDLEGAALAA